MKCVICRGESIEPKDVGEEIRVGNDIVCVPIRALVCQSCGERYYDRRTLRFLEEVEQEVVEGRARVEPVGRVLRYA